MKNNLFFANDCLVYPGAYVPLLKEEEVQSALKLSRKDETVLPPVNVTELADSFKIEVAIPGVKREDFFINVDENILSVCAVHKLPGLHEGEHFKLHEFHYACFDRHIILPENADSDFTCAEYKEGILRLYVPKANTPAKNQHSRIVVY